MSDDSVQMNETVVDLRDNALEEGHQSAARSKAASRAENIKKRVEHVYFDVRILNKQLTEKLVQRHRDHHRHRGLHQLSEM